MNEQKVVVSLKRSNSAMSSPAGERPSKRAASESDDDCESLGVLTPKSNSPQAEIEKCEVSREREQQLDSDIPEVCRSQPYSGPRRQRTQLALGLPPLNKLEDIYKSLTARAIDLKFDDFLSHVGSKPLRVVTMCSGTESPLLALEMVRQSLQKHFNRDFVFNHLFSAEIVPFKQAYIERNFHPRFIFRDVTELKDRVAQTAYGSIEKIPKNVDMLVAGFSCVDFSNLNNKRKTLDEKGESGGTFWGIVRYAKIYRPRLVILENVKGAPWKAIREHWNEIGYYTIHKDVDTKAYYLPQTRERGYMFCVDKGLMKRNNLSQDSMSQWSSVLDDFKRPASCPAGMFLINNDDRRLEQIEMEMRNIQPPSRVINWSKYQIRHQSYRLNQGLGYKRPISRSQDNGVCQMPDFAWQAWMRTLPERVWDTLDVNYLRKLIEGYDMNYKERCIELSQGLDREMDTRAFGIVGCITPTGIPYITTRGGPLCGLESLALQGLPLDRLILTRETQRELQDLAGNAMSSTVVGAAILSALIVGHKVLDQGDQQHETLKEAKGPQHKEPISESSYTMIPQDLKLGEVSDIDLEKILLEAMASARYCMCERQSTVQRNILKCTLCQHTACSACAGNPSHSFERLQDISRSQPLDFIRKLGQVLPARLVLSNLCRDDYDHFKADPSCNVTGSLWEDFLHAVTQAVDDELRFREVKRNDVWTVIYEGRFSILNLVINSSGFKWLLFAKPSDEEPALCLNREIFSKPIAKMAPYPGYLLQGKWEICAPLSCRTTLNIAGTGTQIESLESKCGLEGPEFFGSKIWSHLTVSGSDEAAQNFEVDVRGTYELLPNCGTANAALHKKEATDNSPTVYLFLDPTKLGQPEYDSFVFSLEHNRNPGYSSRQTIAEVSHRWRSWKATNSNKTVNVYYRKWSEIPKVTLEPYLPQAEIECEILDPRIKFPIGHTECHNANMTLLQFSAPAQAVESLWEQGPWKVTDLLDSSASFGDFSWLLQRGASFCEFYDWNNIIITPDSESGHICRVCVPRKPRILWSRHKDNKLRAYEDPHDAALYERQMKVRPALFLAFRRINELGHGCFRVTLNIQSLLHRAYAKLVDSDNQNISLSWRLVSNVHNVRDLGFPKFELKSNRNDPQSSQPPGMQLNLRPEQLRSLSWMIAQEADCIAPFEEEEIEEALLPLMMWRAEGRATREKTVRGGILADQVGYGKTALILGLIDAQFEKDHRQMPEIKDALIPTKATLIIVPRIMIHQWKSEIEKFLGTKYNVLVLPAISSLASKTIRNIQNADIILVTSAMFNSPTYYRKMQAFTGAPRVPSKAGRNFDQWFSDTRNTVRLHAQILQNQGPNVLLESIRARRQEVRAAQANFTYVPSRRLRGKQLAEANKMRECGNQKEVQYADISSGEESDDEKIENAETINEKVDILLRLRSTTSFASNHDSNDTDTSNTTEDESDTVYEDSSMEDHTAEASPRTKRKRKGFREEYKSKTRTWNDRKQFNIRRGEDHQSWADVKNPILHAFSFTRVVVDEFTYADPGRLAPLLSLNAHSKWVLSGTPPLNDFSDVNTISPFLGIHLGVDDDEGGQTQNRRLKAACKHQSDAEKFQSFKTRASEAWHRRRHQLAQKFLDRFARQNVAEIDEIPSTDHVVLISQLPAERAIYLELYKQLMAQNRQLRQGGKGRFSNDQVRRLEEVIGGSKSPEEALLKRCSSLVLQDRWDSKGQPEVITCRSILDIRERQLSDLQRDLRDKLKLAAWVYSKCQWRHIHFDKFKESVKKHDFGDVTVTRQISPLIDTAIKNSKEKDWMLYFVGPADAKAKRQKDDDDENEILETVEDGEVLEGQKVCSTKDDKSHRPAAKRAKVSKPTPNPKPKSKPVKTKQPKSESKKSKGTRRNEKGKEVNDGTENDQGFALPNKPMKTEEFETVLRDVTITLRSLVVEWIVRERALRFLKTVRLLQTCPNPPQCNCCNAETSTFSNLSVLGSCGHILCEGCISQTVENEECKVDGCRGSGKRFNVMDASILGRDDQDRSAQYGGSKLDKLVELLHRIPQDDRVILFIQFPDLMDLACKALDLAKIKYTSISALDRHASKKMEDFQTSSFGESKVLVLNIGSEMAAGLNLQCANHVIFFSPMFTQTQYDYDSAMTQAVGRARRYGQTKHVHVYHFLASGTIDVNIFQERHDRVLVERNGEAKLIPQDEVLDTDDTRCQGLALVADNAF